VETTDAPIIATLAYAAAFNWPLTLAEISERLIVGSRVGVRNASPGLSDIAVRLDALVAAGEVRASMGMYAIREISSEAFTRRIEAEKVTAQKWRRMRRAAWWLQAVPFVRAMLVSGSLANGSSSVDSDWDVFVVVRAGRLYTARIFLLLVALLMGRLRTKRDATAPDKFCFSHYVTTDGLALRHRSLYVAQGIAALMPLIDPDGYLARLRTANGWISEYVRGDSGNEFSGRSIDSSRPLVALRRAIEIVLDTPVGERFERVMRTWQQRRIEHEPATHAPGGRVIADDRILEFHPRSFEAVALARYNSALTTRGMGNFTERDSGLGH